jgi:prolyl 4-hydroxylase
MNKGKYINVIFFVIGVVISFYHINKKKSQKIKIKNNIEFPLNPEVYHKFLNDDEINLLLNSCIEYNNSTIVNGGKIISNFRTSKTCFINRTNKIYDIILKRIKKIFNITSEIEKLQLTRYYPGEYYGEHYDYFDPDNISQNKSIEINGQRMKTIFVYLKEPDEGGETNFPLLKQKFKPKKGSAIVWTNCIIKDNNYILRKETLHSGETVIKGIKIGLNIWILDKK